MVCCRLSRERERDDESSSESDSFPEQDSEEVSIAEEDTFECRTGDGDGRTARGGRGGGRSLSKLICESANDTGLTEGLLFADATFVELRRACARNCPTEMRCVESDEAMLLPRGRAGGSNASLRTCVVAGDSVNCTWRNDFKLNDSKDSTSAGSCGKTGGEGLDFVLSRVTQENRPPEDFELVCTEGEESTFWSGVMGGRRRASAGNERVELMADSSRKDGATGWRLLDGRIVLSLRVVLAAVK